MPGTRRQLVVAALLLAALIGALYAPAVVRGRIISESGMSYANAYPWHALAHQLREPVHHPIESDITLQFDPWRAEYLAAIERGELPLWSTLAYCGVPFAGNGQSSVFFPLNLLAWLVPHLWTFTLSALLKLWLAGLFTYLFCARRGLGGIPGLLAASAFVAGGWMTVWMGHPHTQVAMTLPMLFWAADRWLARPGAPAFAVVALLAGIGWLGGHPETSLHTQGAALVYVLFRVVCAGRGRLRLALGFASAVLLGLCVAAVQLVPLAEYLLQSGVLAGRSGRDLEQPLPWFSSLTFLVPRFFGQHRNGTWWMPAPGWSLTETAAYVGAGALLLALAGLARVRRDSELGSFWLLAAMCAAAIYVAQVQDALALIPLFQATWDVRLLLVLGFALAIAAARSLGHLLGISPGTSESRRAACGILGTAAALEATILAAWAAVRLGHPDLVRDPDFFLWCGLSALAVAASAGLLLAMLRARAARRAALAWGFLLLAIGELFVWSYDYLGFLEPERLAPRTALTDFLLRDRGLYRFYPVGRILPPNTQALYGIPTVLGYDAVEVQRYREAIAPIRNVPFRMRGGAVPEVMRPVLDRLNVKYFVAQPGLAVSGEGIRPVYAGPEGSIFLNERAWSRASWVAAADFDAGRVRASSSGAVDVLAYESHESAFRVRAPADGFLFVSDTFYPGWRAFVDGAERPILRAEGAFRAVAVPAGDHEVRMRYRPASFTLGLATTGVALLACAAALATALRAHTGRPPAALVEPGDSRHPPGARAAAGEGGGGR